MNNFNYYTPTRVVFGKDSEAKAGELILKEGGSKVLIHYGSGSVIKSGLLDRVCKSLEENKIPYVMLGGVVPNPRLSLVYKGMELCKREGVDFILAVGGGSVIDSSKAIGYGIKNDCDVWDFYMGRAVPKDCLPIGAILTIAAAGSEMSNSSVITNEEGWLKKGTNNDCCRCKFALLNPELTYTLPEYQTSSGCVDIMMHTMERFFNRDGENMDITEALSVGLIKTVMKHSKILLKDPKNYESRAEVMWASSLSHNGLMACGTLGGDWCCHKLEHEIGGKFDVAHGAGLSAIWGSFARYVCDENIDVFARFAYKVMDITPTEDKKADVLKGIEAMEDFYRSINMPTSISELGVSLTDEDILDMALKIGSLGTGVSGAVKPLYKDDIIKIYNMAK